VGVPFWLIVSERESPGSLNVAVLMRSPPFTPPSTGTLIVIFAESLMTLGNTNGLLKPSTDVTGPVAVTVFGDPPAPVSGTVSGPLSLRVTEVEQGSRPGMVTLTRVGTVRTLSSGPAG